MGGAASGPWLRGECLCWRSPWPAEHEVVQDVHGVLAVLTGGVDVAADVKPVLGGVVAGQAAGDLLLCDTRSHVVSELVEEVWLDAGDIATGLCSTCPRRDVRGRFLIGWVRSSRKSPRAAVPAMAVTGEGKDRNRATIRKPLLMPRH